MQHMRVGYDGIFIRAEAGKAPVEEILQPGNSLLVRQRITQGAIQRARIVGEFSRDLRACCFQQRRQRRQLH